MATARRSGSVLLRLTESEAAALMEVLSKVHGQSHMETIFMALHSAGVRAQQPARFSGDMYVVPRA